MGHDSQQGSDLGAGDLIPGAVLRGRYVLEQVIGRGGQSLIFRAKDLHRATGDEPDGGRVALKALQPSLRANPRAIERLAREFRQMQRLSHPGIARVFDLDCDGDIWFMTMELVDAPSAAEWLRTSPVVSNAIQVVGRCADALQYAHSMGVIHGDFKPCNVLVASDLQVKLIDFGSAALQGDAVNCIAVTPSYASPQVLAGMPAEARDDVFSLACVSYEILSEGERPFGDLSSLEAHRARLCPAAIAGMPVNLFAALARSLAGDRGQRAASVEAFYHELLGNVVALPRRAGGAVLPGQGSRRTLRHISLASIGVAAACSLVLLLPTARKIVAGDDEVAAATSAVPAMIDHTAGGEVMGDQVAGMAAVAEPASSEDTLISDGASLAPRAAGFVSFENAVLVASSAQSMIAIPVKRTQSTHGQAAVEWQVQGGAGANIDYKWMQPQIVRFNDGEAVRSIFIPLVHGGSPGATRVARRFTVLLRRVGGGVRLGAVTQVSVTIVPQPLLPDLSKAVAASFTER